MNCFGKFGTIGEKGMSEAGLRYFQYVYYENSENKGEKNIFELYKQEGTEIFNRWENLRSWYKNRK